MFFLPIAFIVALALILLRFPQLYSMRWFRAFTLLGVIAAAVMVLDIVAAIAATEAAVPVSPAASQSLVINIGVLIGQFLTWAESIMVVIVTGLTAKLAPPIVRQFLTDRALTNAIHWGIGAVENATKDKTITIDVANQVLFKALQFVQANYPQVAARLGDNLKSSLLARLSANANLAPEVTASALKVPSPKTAEEKAISGNGK